MVRRTRLAVCAAGVAKNSQAPEKGSMMLMMMTMDDVMMSRTTTGTGGHGWTCLLLKVSLQEAISFKYRMFMTHDEANNGNAQARCGLATPSYYVRCERFVVLLLILGIFYR